MARTETWSEFPNGRWGEHGLPAFGELAGWDGSVEASAVGTAEERRSLWGEALSSETDVYEVFARYVEGRVQRLPWCDQPLHAETGPIADPLAHLNRGGFLTINSQPRVNGVRSDDPVFGWGGPGGYVYQKAYIECFCSPLRLRALIEVSHAFPSVTYTALDQRNQLYTNCRTRSVQAVTWGVFPGKEVMQPTVVDPESFRVWKDEAFGLWSAVWASAYDDDSESADVLHRVQNSFFLVNVVDHDFIRGDLFRVFEVALRRADELERSSRSETLASSEVLRSLGLTSGGLSPALGLASLPPIPAASFAAAPASSLPSGSGSGGATTPTSAAAALVGGATSPVGLAGASASTTTAGVGTAGVPSGALALFALTPMEGGGFQLVPVAPGATKA